MIHLQVPISAEHQAVVALELVGVDNGSSADLLDREPHQRFGRNIRNHGNLNNAVPLQDSEDGHFAGRPSSTFSLALAAKVSLIQFDLPAQQSLGIASVAQDRKTNGPHGFIHCPVRQTHLLRHLTDRNLQFKELDQGQPLSAGQSPLVDPPSRKLVEGIGTTRATVSLIGQFVQLMALATGSIPFMVFKAFSQQIFSSLALTANQIIISI